MMLSMTKHVIVKSHLVLGRVAEFNLWFRHCNIIEKRTRKSKGDSSRLTNQTAVSNTTTGLCIEYFKALPQRRSPNIHANWSPDVLEKRLPQANSCPYNKTRGPHLCIDHLSKNLLLSTETAVNFFI